MSDEKSICDGCPTRSSACRLNDSASQCVKWKRDFCREWNALVEKLRKQWGIEPKE